LDLSSGGLCAGTTAAAGTAGDVAWPRERRQCLPCDAVRQAASRTGNRFLEGLSDETVIVE